MDKWHGKGKPREHKDVNSLMSTYNIDYKTKTQEIEPTSSYNSDSCKTGRFHHFLLLPVLSRYGWHILEWLIYKQKLQQVKMDSTTGAETKPNKRFWPKRSHNTTGLNLKQQLHCNCFFFLDSWWGMHRNLFVEVKGKVFILFPSKWKLCWLRPQLLIQANISSRAD